MWRHNLFHFVIYYILDCCLNCDVTFVPLDCATDELMRWRVDELNCWQADEGQLIYSTLTCDVIFVPYYQGVGVWLVFRLGWLGVFGGGPDHFIIGILRSHWLLILTSLLRTPIGVGKYIYLHHTAVAFSYFSAKPFPQRHISKLAKYFAATAKPHIMTKFPSSRH